MEAIMLDPSPIIEEGTECDFCRLLREVLAGSKPVDALFEHPKVKERGLLICLGLTENRTDADDLYQETCFKVARNMVDRFAPDHTRHYGNFFAWFKTIATNKFIDDLPKPDEQFVDVRADDLFDLKDYRANAEVQLLCRELEEHVNNLSEVEMLATRLFLEGYSLREIELKLNGLGIKCSHTTIRKYISEGLRPFFPDAKALFAHKKSRRRKARTLKPSQPARRIAAGG
jgi:DNA-directed RNA polymerase specialized sigma24 family protein